LLVPGFATRSYAGGAGPPGELIQHAFRIPIKQSLPHALLDRAGRQNDCA
jgi:hypothetical protein